MFSKAITADCVKLLLVMIVLKLPTYASRRFHIFRLDKAKYNRSSKTANHRIWDEEVGSESSWPL